jgi:acyl-coenzyme A thioesterase PaaI-like protein
VSDTPAGFVIQPPISGFMTLIGNLYVREDMDGFNTLGVRIDNAHLNHQGAVHGGFVSTLADNAIGTHVARAMGGPVATVNLSLDFLGRIKRGEWLEVKSRIDRQGKRLVYAACEGRVGNELVFRATAIFSKISMSTIASSTAHHMDEYGSTQKII